MLLDMEIWKALEVSTVDEITNIVGILLNLAVPVQDRQFEVF